MGIDDMSDLKFTDSSPPASEHQLPPPVLRRTAPLLKQRTWSPDTYREEAWQRRKDRRNRKTKSLTDDDLDELKACVELGFGLDSPDLDKDKRLSDAFPALDFYHAVNQQYYRTVSKSYSNASSSSSSSLSESDLASPVGSHLTSMFSPGEDPERVKTRLKQWAQVVAFSVRQSSSSSLSSSSSAATS